MNWINLQVSIIRSPAYVGSTPTERATWFNVLAYCIEHENGGVIAGCLDWKDRQWQQTCGVSAREVRNASKLLKESDNGIQVEFYPMEKQDEVQGLRELGKSKSPAKAAAARLNGTLGGRPKNPTEEPKENPSKPNEKPIEVEVEVERKEKGKEVEGETLGFVLASPAGEAATASKSVLSFNCAGTPDRWELTDEFCGELQKLYPSIHILKELEKAASTITHGAVTKKTARGMPRFIMSWLDRATNSVRPPQVGAMLEARFNKF